MTVAKAFNITVVPSSFLSNCIKGNIFITKYVVGNYIKRMFTAIASRFIGTSDSIFYKYVDKQYIFKE